jgi:predicted 3-demethylubiquinone-9 3-methyltransferase (glyoxalase superfamily)
MPGIGIEVRDVPPAEKDVFVAILQKITPSLWFDDQAEQAANFYTAIFPNSKIGRIVRYGEAGKDFHGKAPGSVMTIEFMLDGQPFSALNGGPIFKFNEAISFQIGCETQAEVDHFWNRLSEGGDPHAQQCGWLKDKFGVSWQVVPNLLMELLSDPDEARSQRIMMAVLRMKKLVIEELKRAATG